MGQGGSPRHAGYLGEAGSELIVGGRSCSKNEVQTWVIKTMGIYTENVHEHCHEVFSGLINSFFILLITSGKSPYVN